MNTTNLKFLVDNSNMTKQQITVALGLNMLSLNKYLDGVSAPRLDILIRIADLFAVPLDYLCGRCTKEECNAIEESFADNFRILRRGDYERCILKFRESSKLKDGYHGPYPYNLLDDIFKDPFDHVLSEDEENGLNQALSSLSEREQQMIDLYYGKEMTLAKAGEVCGIGQERVRQIIAKALRKLRHPSRLNQIRYGERDNIRRIELNNKELELRERERIIEYNERLLEEHISEANKVLNLREAYRKEQEEASDFDREGPHHSCSSAFMEMDLSVRAYNCLLRSGLNTVQKTLDAICTPDKYWIHDSKAFRLRNVGKQTYGEILNKIEEATGVDLSAYRCGCNIFDDNGNLIT